MHEKYSIEAEHSAKYLLLIGKIADENEENREKEQNMPNEQIAFVPFRISLLL